MSPLIFQKWLKVLFEGGGVVHDLKKPTQLELGHTKGGMIWGLKLEQGMHIDEPC